MISKWSIAALFVRDFGPYFGLEGVDPWPQKRDARLYRGPYPVVAHPPCQLWGKFAKVNYARWGGDHNRPGNDGGCFQSALDSVNKFGGVLEHPAMSYAWDHHGLIKPCRGAWSRSGGGYVCEVWQNAYGHKARKATWLYYVGTRKPPDLIWDYCPAEFQIGFHDQRGKKKNKPTVTKKEAIDTPQAFKDILIFLAKYSRGWCK